MIRRWFLGIIVVGAAVLLWATPVAAHASLQQTDPAADSVETAPPNEVELRFDEPVDANVGRVTVIGPDGRRADGGVVRPRSGGRSVITGVDAQVRGSYLVEWSVVSEDGHLLQGSFVYSVGRPSSVAARADEGRTAVRGLAWAARLLAYAGSTILVGSLTVVALFRRRLGDSRQLPKAVLVASLCVGAGVAVLLFTQTALASGRPLAEAGSLLDATVDTRTGGLLAARLALAVTAAALAVLWLLTRHHVVAAALAVPVAAGLVVTSLAGHAWSTEPRALAVVVDIAHLAATGAWIGGVVMAVASTGFLSLGDRLRAFSPVATWAVTATVATGVVSSWLQTRSIEAATDTGYGQLLVAKVVLVVAVVVAAATVRRAIHGTTAPVRIVGTEIALAVIVLGVTSALVNQPPARDALVRPISAFAETAGEVAGGVQVQIQPARAGTNDIHVYFFDDRGLTRSVDVVELTLARPGQPARRLKVTPVTPQHVSAYSALIPSAGTWELTVTSLAAGRQSSATLEVRIR